jgi:DNA polymerase-3 subunit gamma/tau
MPHCPNAKGASTPARRIASMSHVVLARKYRPRSFEQMVGQVHVVQALGNALTSGRLHHAYLFTGTRGIGKTTVSRILAKSLNCTGPDGTGGVTAHPCGVCQACTEIDADRYIDYIELDAASNRSIDEIRELIERAAYKPSVGRFKVFMIDEAHQLTKDAFNALLKTLEEPPDYLKFVLATTDPEKMLPTVLSRCLQFNLRPMAPETVHAYLQEVLAAEGVPADAGSLRLLSRAARGSMRDALSLTDQAIAFGAGSLAEDGVRAMLGTVDRSHAANIVRSLAARDGTGVLATVQALRSHGLSASGTLEELAALLQQMAVEQAVPGALDDADTDTAVARELAALLPADETQLLYSMAIHGRAELSLVSDEYAALTMVLLRLLSFPAAGAPAPAPRAAPLVATPREARATAPARAVPAAPPIVLPKPQSALKVAPAVVVAPVSAEASATAAPAVAPPPAPGSAASRFTPPAPSAALQAQEPPPWVDDEVPDDDSPRAPSRVQANALDDDAPTMVEDQPPPARVPAPAPVRPAAITRPALQPTALGDQWSDLLRPVAAAGGVAAMVRELAWQAELIGVQPADGGGRVWQLRVERETLHNPSLAAKLSAALAKALDEPVHLDVLPGLAQDSLARRDALAREQAQHDAEQVIQHDPVVQALLAQFSTARIVPGSIKPVAADGGPNPSDR